MRALSSQYEEAKVATLTSPRCSRGLYCMFLLCACVTARGELVLTNYNAANPLKIMAVGDSITDDCVISGAWRKPLHPILETNDFPFTFVGRKTSPASLGFSKVKHEGYCGAVVSPPGIFYGADNYLCKIVREALTNAAPDVMLIMIGANDIGQGRNPYVVATNNMVTLLGIIFSNAPNTHVVLAKATTQQNATGYSQNIPIYNAALQGVVNQRRALGQKVYLADLYSVVDYATMFNADHLHPNSVGLQAIAKEWLVRLQSITIRTNLITSTLINGGASWKYNDTGQDLGTNWAQINYDDSGWSNGVARLGYGDSATATTVSFGPQSANKYVTTYFRRPFVVPWNVVLTNLNLRVARADGAAVWLNGQEIYRTNLPAGPIAYTNLASSATTIHTRHIFCPTNVPVTNFPTGTNWIAVEVHLGSVTASAMGFDMELIGNGYLLPTPSLSITPAGDNLLFRWPTNGGGFTLYSTTNPAETASWTTVSAAMQTNDGQITVTQSVDSSAKFFRLQQP
jgi:GDSL-like Lipase/Acylhydrolase family